MTRKTGDRQTERSKILNMYIKRSSFRQKDIAEKLGVSEITVSYWCSGRSWPTPKNLEGLSDLLGVPAGVIEGVSPIPFPEDYEEFREQANLLGISYGDILRLAAEIN